MCQGVKKKMSLQSVPNAHCGKLKIFVGKKYLATFSAKMLIFKAIFWKVLIFMRKNMQEELILYQCAVRLN